MNRREVFAVLGGAAVTWPGTLRAQQTGMPVIGYLSSANYGPSLDSLRAGLAEQGYVEGSNLQIEYRSAEGEYDRLPALAAELVNRHVDLIICGGGAMTARAAKPATSTIPIVMISGADPVAAGLVASLSRPGGNITGVAQLVVEADAKRVQIFHELLPGISTFGYLENPTLTNSEQQTQNLEAAARTLRIQFIVVRAANDAELTTAFTRFRNEKISGLIVHADPFFFMRRNEIVRLAADHGLPTMYFFRDFVTAGGLMSYGTRLSEAYHQAGVYAGRILKGARPADLPILQQSEKIELVINLKTAKALGVTVPQALLVRADEVIE
jgi:ABC-type uncharacterized transport system substrate-binding protein